MSNSARMWTQRRNIYFTNNTKKRRRATNRHYQSIRDQQEVIVIHRVNKQIGTVIANKICGVVE